MFPARGWMSTCVAVAAALFAGLIGPGGAVPAAGHDYQPLDVGTEWHYTNDLTQSYNVLIVGHLAVLGAEAAVRLERIEAGRDLVDVFENYWTEDAEGNLYLHGAANLTDSIVQWAYLPPILMVDAPLELDKRWLTADVEIVDLDGIPLQTLGDYALRVYSSGDVVVPAGTFYAYGVGLDPGPSGRVELPRGAFDLLGRRIGEAAASREAAGNWYSDGVGRVQHTAEVDQQHMNVLLSWGISPVSQKTWGAIKWLFR